MTANTTQRVDVARLEIGLREDGSPKVFVKHNGPYVRHSDYAALLQQLAERDAECERLRAENLRVRGQRIAALVQRNEQREAKEAAERAREEAVRAMDWYDDNQHMVAKCNGQWFAIVGNRDTVVQCDNGLDAIVAAFLAANGGKNET